MTTMRLHYKFLLLLIPVALAWSQYVTAEHEWVDHAAIDDCLTCKLAENVSDKPKVVDLAHTVHLSTDSVDIHFSEDIYYPKLWDIPSSRAPPVS